MPYICIINGYNKDMNKETFTKRINKIKDHVDFMQVSIDADMSYGTVRSYITGRTIKTPDVTKMEKILLHAEKQFRAKYNNIQEIANELNLAS